MASAVAVFTSGLRVGVRVTVGFNTDVAVPVGRRILVEPLPSPGIAVCDGVGDGEERDTGTFVRVA